MPKIAFIGAGSTVFAKNVLGDCMLTPSLANSEFALFDIDSQRLEDSKRILDNLKTNLNTRVEINAYFDRRQALRNANYVVNAIQVGGYRPCTVTDFEVPKKYGLRQTIGDTVGIGGLFRALRTIPVMLDISRDMEELCPEAWLLNYTNPMASVTGATIRYGHQQTVGLCHSVQSCAKQLLEPLGMDMSNIQWKIAGINHMAWLLKITRDGVDLYPEIKRRARELQDEEDHDDRVRHEIMNRFGYYSTESSEHLSEYLPYFIKSQHPELIERYNIPLDEYPRRCERQIQEWNDLREQLINDTDLEHERSREYGSYIMEAMETNKPFKFGGNVVNQGRLISNLPQKACVEVPCVADRSGIAPCWVGDLPEQLAALNQTNINTQLLAVEAAVTGKKEYIYQAALLDPHTSAELTIDQTVALCDDLIEAHGDWLPEYH